MNDRRTWVRYNMLLLLLVHLGVLRRDDEFWMKPSVYAKLNP